QITAPVESAKQEASTNCNSSLEIGPRMGCSVKVGQLAEEGEAVIDFLARELLEALGAEALHRERAHDAAIEHGAMIDGGGEFGLRGEIAEEAAGKAVARASGVDYFFERKCGDVKRTMGELFGTL